MLLLTHLLPHLVNKVKRNIVLGGDHRKRQHGEVNVIFNCQDKVTNCAHCSLQIMEQLYVNLTKCQQVGFSTFWVVFEEMSTTLLSSKSLHTRCLSIFKARYQAPINKRGILEASHSLLFAATNLNFAIVKCAVQLAPFRVLMGVPHKPAHFTIFEICAQRTQPVRYPQIDSALLLPILRLLSLLCVVYFIALV
jgi:hypothetical protein